MIVTGRFKGKAKSGAELDAAFEHDYELTDGKLIGWRQAGPRRLGSRLELRRVKVIC